MIGKCLCGEIRFEITGEIPNLYQCHCSLCRKVTGTSANAATFINQENFNWLSGKDNIRSFIKETGFRSDFCSTCGSPAPNKLRGTSKYWVPAGLLEETEGLEVVEHIYTNSKAQWDLIGDHGTQHEQMPSLEALNKALQRTSR
jgi:hypothetical protein